MLLGVFASASERQPSNLDLCLFDWSFLSTGNTRAGASVTAGRDMDANVSAKGLSSMDSEAASSSAQPTKPVAAGTIPPTSTPLLESASSIAVDVWTGPQPGSGVSSTRRCVGGGKKSVEVRLVSATPSRAYVEKTVPLKIKLWIGISEKV